ncbi:MAG: Fic family protein [Desulfobulbaceae bacterium]|jgi:Fic family protein|nr:Fic family protein [Desulfobulbaceae bacterium]
MRKQFINLLTTFKASGIPEAINFVRINEMLISHHSTALEGSSLTAQESVLLLNDGLTAKGKPITDHDMLRDHHNALLYVVQSAQQKQLITPEIIQHVSALTIKNTGGIINALAGSYDSSRGDFRKSMVYVGSRYFANFQKVPGQVKVLCRHINERLNNVSEAENENIYALAFDAHFRLVTIHPFADGNGRVSRLLMNYILAYHQEPLAMIFAEDKLEYYAALEAAREEENPELFQNFMFGQQEKYFSLELAKIR